MQRDYRQQRNARRMAEFNNQQADRSGRWSDMVEAEHRGRSILEAMPPLPPRENALPHRGRGRPRPGRRNTAPAQRPTPAPASVATAIEPSPLFEGRLTGSRVVVEAQSHNYDFSGYLILMHALYDVMTDTDVRIRRSLPYCAFQHYCVELLNGVAIERVMSQNAEGRFRSEERPFEFLDIKSKTIPTPIVDYLSAITRTTMANGKVINFNLPAGGTPQHSTDDDIPSGTFGICDEGTHNSYECYISPYVTRRLVEHTITANERNGNFDPWNPLPAALSPPDAVATRNLLGYDIPESLQTESLNSIRGFIFEDADDRKS
uniref:Uncharacterized protein n=2 Tax=Lutzomyia longipalpis TaxID=7200 RepID=A0A1B0GHN4_LUTLO